MHSTEEKRQRGFCDGLGLFFWGKSRITLLELFELFLELFCSRNDEKHILSKISEHQGGDGPREAIIYCKRKGDRRKGMSGGSKNKDNCSTEGCGSAVCKWW